MQGLTRQTHTFIHSSVISQSIYTSHSTSKSTRPDVPYPHNYYIVPIADLIDTLRDRVDIKIVPCFLEFDLGTKHSDDAKTIQEFIRSNNFIHKILEWDVASDSGYYLDSFDDEEPDDTVYHWRMVDIVDPNQEIQLDPSSLESFINFLNAEVWVEVDEVQMVDDTSYVIFAKEKSKKIIDACALALGLIDEDNNPLEHVRWYEITNNFFNQSLEDTLYSEKSNDLRFKTFVILNHSKMYQFMFEMTDV